jgi:competence protein ComEC
MNTVANTTPNGAPSRGRETIDRSFVGQTPLADDSVWQQPMAVALIVFAGGVLIDMYWELPLGFWLCIAVSNGVCSLLGWRDNASLPLLTLGFLATGGLTHASCQRAVAPHHVATFATVEPVPVVVEGYLEQSPRSWASSHGIRWTASIQLLRIRDGKHWRDASGRVQVYGHDRCSAGERTMIRVAGLLRQPSPPSNPGELDQRDQLLRRGIHAELQLPMGGQATVAGPPRPWKVAERLRRHACQVIAQWFPRDTAALMAAMTWGKKDELSHHQKEMFSRAGAAHFLAISGLHLGILCGILLSLARLGWLPRRVLWIVVGLFAITYAAVCGARTPVLRAAWLVLATIAARWIGRRPLRWSRLAVPAWVILLVDPSDLRDPATQLSFVAVAVILLHWKPRRSRSPIETLLWRTLPAWQRPVRRHLARLGEAYLLNLRICLHMAPLVAFYFEGLAVAALLLNPLLGPPVAVALASCFLLAFISGLPLVSHFLCLICLAAVMSLNALLAVGGTAPFLAVPGLCAGRVAAYYVVWFVSRLIPLSADWRLRWSVLAAMLLFWFAAFVQPLVDSPATTQHRDSLTLTFLSVGHGLCVVIQSPDGENWLYDAGSTGDGKYAARRIAAVLTHLQIRHLDGVIVSHFDADHYNAIPWLAQGIDVEKIVTNDRRLAAFIQRKLGSEMKVILEDLPRDLPHCFTNWRFENLPNSNSPNSNSNVPGSTDNERSLVLLGEFGGKRICLTGDLEGQGLRNLVTQITEPIDILLVPHHGSRHSSPHVTADWAKPTYAIISGGRQDRNHEVADAYGREGTQLLHTFDGAVQIVIEEKSSRPVRVVQWRVGGWREGQRSLEK